MGWGWGLGGCSPGCGVTRPTEYYQVLRGTKDLLLQPLSLVDAQGTPPPTPPPLIHLHEHTRVPTHTSSPAHHRQRGLTTPKPTQGNPGQRVVSEKDAWENTR